MKPLNSSERYKFILSDSFSFLKQVDNEYFNCIITSPPYWNMRKYDNSENENEIGNEENFNDYINNLKTIFAEAKRTLRNDGSLWLNLGDKYNDKALMGMPWRVAFALIDDGWILRNDVIWSQMKGTQSCKDRLRDSYEHIFHFVKSKKYFYDGDAIRIKPNKLPEISNGKTISATGVSGIKYKKMIAESTFLSDDEKKNAFCALEKTIEQVRNGEIIDFRMTIRGAQRPWHSDDASVSGRAAELQKKGYYVMKMGAKGALPTDIWNVVTEDTWRKDSHCAVYPEELLRIPILATCPENGIILDPFSGTGTTVSASYKMNRRCVGIDLSEKYIKISEDRMSGMLL